jgi:hypothetical protein
MMSINNDIIIYRVHYLVSSNTSNSISISMLLAAKASDILLLSLSRKALITR